MSALSSFGQAFIKKDKSAVTPEIKEVESKNLSLDDVRYPFSMYFARPDSTVWRLLQGNLACCRAFLKGPLYPLSEIVSEMTNQKCDDSVLDDFYVTDALDLAYQGEVLSTEELQNRLSRINEMLCQIAKNKVGEVYYLESSVKFKAMNDAAKALTGGKIIKIYPRYTQYRFSISFADEMCSVSSELSKFTRFCKACGEVDPYSVQSFGARAGIISNDAFLETFSMTRSRELVYKGIELTYVGLKSDLQEVYNHLCYVTKQITEKTMTEYVESTMLIKAADDAAKSLMGNDTLEIIDGTSIKGIATPRLVSADDLHGIDAFN